MMEKNYLMGYNQAIQDMVATEREVIEAKAEGKSNSLITALQTEITVEGYNALNDAMMYKFIERTKTPPAL